MKATLKLGIYTGITLIILSSCSSGEEEAAKQREKDRADKQSELLKTYNLHLGEIHDSIDSALNRKDAARARAILNIYSSLKDSSVTIRGKFDSIASVISTQEVKARTFELLSRLQNNKDLTTKEQLDIYKQLTHDNPNNEKFAKKQNALQKKADLEPLTEDERQAIDKQIQIQFSPWDGSHRNLEKYIKESMNDADSYEHMKTSYAIYRDHIVVITKFRGKNAFGAMMINTVKASISLDGNSIYNVEQYAD